MVAMLDVRDSNRGELVVEPWLYDWDDWIAPMYCQACLNWPLRTVAGSRAGSASGELTRRRQQPRCGNDCSKGHKFHLAGRCPNPTSAQMPRSTEGAKPKPRATGFLRPPRKIGGHRSTPVEPWRQVNTARALLIGT